MTIYEKKKSFVENELQKLAIAFGRGVTSLEYQGDSVAEFVKIQYIKGFEIVHVTADSLRAIALDVIKNIG